VETVLNLLQNPYDTTHLTLGVSLHYLGKLKLQIFCRYSAHMEENANMRHKLVAHMIATVRQCHWSPST